MIVQIYAFTRVDQVIAAVELGVDHIGFVVGEYGLVHGELSFATARQLARAVPEGRASVALTMATDVDEILRMVEIVEPNIVHISTDLDDVGVEAMERLRRELPSAVRLMKAIHVEDERSLEDARRFAPVSDILLLDTKVSGMPGIGATGRAHNWRVSREIVQAVRIPVILAGGLSPQNVVEAIRVVQPWGVDSNTWTNIPGDPVEKDMERVRAFVNAVRSAMG